MPRFALALGILSLACSVSVVAFFVGVPLGLLAVTIALAGVLRFEDKSRMRRISSRALVVGGLGLAAGLFVWFVHVRAIQTAYRVPSRGDMASDFETSLAHATAPLPTAPPRAAAPLIGVKPKAAH